jgi:polyhydroxybutyrate depolymerase
MRVRTRRESSNVEAVPSLELCAVAGLRRGHGIRAAAVRQVFAFHGAGDTAENFASIDLHHAWPQAMIVYMNGLSRGSNQGGAFQTNDAGPDNRDLKFFDVALADLRQRFAIDDTRIYATGFSNGAKLTRTSFSCSWRQSTWPAGSTAQPASGSPVVRPC